MIKQYFFTKKFDGSECVVTNPTFCSYKEKYLISGIRVSEKEFQRVLSEWSKDQIVDNSINTEQQWIPKVGEWVRVKEGCVSTDRLNFTDDMQALCGCVFRVTRVSTEDCDLSCSRNLDCAFEFHWLEPATPQSIDRLGWWLIDDEPELIISNDRSDIPWGAHDGEWFDINQQGIFLSEITDEELAAFHRHGTVPKCPVNASK